jgi:hypothetical protein
MVLFGAPFALFGGALFLQGLGIVPVLSQMNGPRWLLVPVGLVFLAPGVLYCQAGFRIAVTGRPPDPSDSRRSITRMLAVFLTGMSLALVGVAFFGDPRGFYGGIPGTTIDKRLMFGIGGLFVGAIAAVYWVLVTVSALRGPWKRTSDDRGV